MSELARAFELVEKAAEEDANACREPDASAAIATALWRTHPDAPGFEVREMMALRYGLFYAATMAYPDEAPDVVVRRWREIS